MSDKLLAFTQTTGSYAYSSELSLCLRNFEASLPSGSSLIIAEGDTMKNLRDLVVRHQSEKKSEYILLLKEPAILMTGDTIETLIKTLKVNPAVSCVLPSDIRGYRPGRNARYYTLRGFESFVDSLKDDKNPILAYDGRDPFMFLLRTDVFCSLAVPENPIDIPRILPAGSVIISLNAYIHPFIDYYEEKRTDVLRLIPRTIRSLLDVGCARGNFGKAVHSEIGCRVVGIEMNEHEAQKARPHFDRLIKGDFMKSIVDERFDCITCLDVIEHIADIDTFLERIKSLLNDGGYVLISVPNVGHWSILEDLLAGRWDYVPTGIMTISHLRFFTRKTIESLLIGAGFTIVMVEAQHVPPPENIGKALGEVGRNHIEVDHKSLSSLGYYILARKAE